MASLEGSQGESCGVPSARESPKRGLDLGSVEKGYRHTLLILHMRLAGKVRRLQVEGEGLLVPPQILKARREVVEGDCIVGLSLEPHRPRSRWNLFPPWHR